MILSLFFFFTFRSCDIIDLSPMSYIFATFDADIRGDCGHLKAMWDNHTNCLSCSRYSTVLVCKNWTGSI